MGFARRQVKQAHQESIVTLKLDALEQVAFIKIS